MGGNEQQQIQTVIKNESLQAVEEEEEDEDDDDGPPPGFDSILVNFSTHQKSSKQEDDDEDDDGPPPGFQLLHLKNENSKQKFTQEDDDGPPPGFGDDEAEMPNSHSVPAVEVEVESGLKPNSQSESVSFDGSEKLGFRPVPDRERDDDVSMPNSNSIPILEVEIESGLNPNCDSQSVGDGSQKLGFRPIPEIEGERQGEGDGSGIGFKLFSVNGEEKSDGSDTVFQSVHVRGAKRERDEFELGYQSVPIPEDEKVHSILGKEECGDDDEGPPPGWDSFPATRPPIESPSPPHGRPSAIYCVSGSQSTHVKEEEKVGDIFELGSQSVPKDGEEVDGFELELQSITVGGGGGGDGEGPSFPSSHVKKEVEGEDEEGPAPGWDSFPPERPPYEALASPQLPSLSPEPSHPPPSAASSGKAQMVCGSCRRLLSYSRGSRFVQCSCCQTVNLVLEEHQVGQVKCRGCAVLLMYPFGAPSVQCSSCLFVTKIGVQNKRPPLSVQQGRPRVPAYPVH